MSWSINKCGKASAIARVIKADPNVPASITAIVESLPERDYAVDGSGHHGGDYSYVKLEIKALDLVK